MKKIAAFIIAVVFLLFAAVAIATAQTAKRNPFASSSQSIEHSFANQVDAILNVSRDTLTIPDDSRIKFIKIGNDVYQLVKHNATIEKVPEGIHFGNFFNTPGNILTFPPGGSITPTYEMPADNNLVSPTKPISITYRLDSTTNDIWSKAIILGSVK